MHDIAEHDVARHDDIGDYKKAEQQCIKVEYRPFGKRSVSKEIHVGNVTWILDECISRKQNCQRPEYIHELPAVLPLYLEADFGGVLYRVSKLDPTKGRCAEYELPCRIGFCACNKIVTAKKDVANQVARLPEYADNHQLVYGSGELLD
jgi:hypothetical protein